jgi:hypothetical protein
VNIEDFTQGQKLEYRPVLSIPCTPITAYFVEESASYPGRALIDCGATGYDAPHDRDRRIVWPSHLANRA